MSSAGAETTTIMTSLGPVPVTLVPFVPRAPFDGLFDPDILDWWRPPTPSTAADRGRKRGRGPGTSDDDDALARQLREVAAADRSDGSGEECAICLHGFRDEETLRAMPACAHAFHHHCICEWLRRNPVCPLCRRRLPATPGDDDDDDDKEVDDDWEDWVGSGISWEVEEEGYDETRMTRRRFRLI